MSVIGHGLDAVVAAVLVASVATAESGAVVGLEGQPSFRDLGGYMTVDGRTLREGLVFRSGELPRATDADLETLEELGVRTVVSFLTEGETEYRGPDCLPEGVREISLPITGDVGGIPDAANLLVEARRTGDFRHFPPEFNPLVHEELVSGMADSQYSELFEILSDDSNYPVVFHCSHGIHRTGTAAALVLSALGVPWEVIREDYLCSNETRASEVMPRIEELKTLASEIDMSPEDRARNTAAIEAFYLLEPADIDAPRPKGGSADSMGTWRTVSTCRKAIWRLFARTCSSERPGADERRAGRLAR